MANVLPVDPGAIRAARLRAGWTQHELARRLGIRGAGDQVSRWETGLSTPRLDMVARLSTVLGVPVEQFLASDVVLVGLARLRAGSGLTVREVAERCHVSVSTYERWEKGRSQRSPDDSGIAVLAEVFGVEQAVVRRAVDEARRAR